MSTKHVGRRIRLTAFFVWKERMAITGAEREKEYRTLVALTRIHQSIGALMDLDEIARILVREIKGVVNCDGCAILLIEKNGVKVLASLGFPHIFQEGQFTTDAPFIHYLVTTKQGIASGDVPASDHSLRPGRHNLPPRRR